MGKKLKQKYITNQYGEVVKVCLFKTKYGYQVVVENTIYAVEYNELFAVQRFNEI